MRKKLISQKNRPPFDVFIFVSSEDDKYRVAGGIGTYLGLMTKYCKKLWPTAEVYWLTKSPNKKSFYRLRSNVHCHYISPGDEFLKSPGFDQIPSKQHTMIVQELFVHTVNAMLFKIISGHKNERIYIESGEWEGHASIAFSMLQNENIFKTTRLHTPLASCVAQNNLSVTCDNALQLLNEFATIHNADCISASTNHIKSKVIHDVLSKKINRKLRKKMVVLPNPVDVENFAQKASPINNRTKAISYLNRCIGHKFFTTKSFNILIIGSVEYRKGIEIAKKAIPGLIQFIPGARICFIGHHAQKGEGQLTANTKASPETILESLTPKEKERVAFTGYIKHEKLPLVLAAGDAFPILSLEDNFPGTVAEIALAKKPVVALMRGGVKEMINYNKKCYAYSLGSDIEKADKKLVKKIAYIYNNPNHSKQVSEELCAMMQKRFQPETVLKNMFHYYEVQFKTKRQV